MKKSNKQKKQFNHPQVEIIKFDEIDIIVTSGDSSGDPEGKDDL